MTVERMKYKNYKEHYADCETVPGSYDKGTKSIEVIIPDGRMKNSGVRGHHFRGYQFDFINNKGEKKYVAYRAVSEENAKKRFLADCKAAGWEPLECSKVFI